LSVSTRKRGKVMGWRLDRKIEKEEIEVLSLSVSDIKSLVKVGVGASILICLLVGVVISSSMWVEVLLLVMMLPITIWTALVCLLLFIDKAKDDLGKFIERFRL
jgi:Flp pilus assembly protein TadB